MKGMIAVLKRELLGYFITPVAYVFIVVFLMLTGVFTFNIGQFFERGQADLQLSLYYPLRYDLTGEADPMEVNRQHQVVGLIRTLLVKDGELFLRTGAGIVADSDPEFEFEECENKARALVQAIDLAREGVE